MRGRQYINDLYDCDNKKGVPVPAAQFDSVCSEDIQGEIRRLEKENSDLKWLKWQLESDASALRLENQTLRAKNDDLVNVALHLAANAPPKHLWNASEAYWAPEYQK